MPRDRCTSGGLSATPRGTSLCTLQWTRAGTPTAPRWRADCPWSEFRCLRGGRFGLPLRNLGHSRFREKQDSSDGYGIFECQTYDFRGVDDPHLDEIDVRAARGVQPHVAL